MKRKKERFKTFRTGAVYDYLQHSFLKYVTLVLIVFTSPTIFGQQTLLDNAPLPLQAGIGYNGADIFNHSTGGSGRAIENDTKSKYIVDHFQVTTDDWSVSSIEVPMVFEGANNVPSQPFGDKTFLVQIYSGDPRYDQNATVVWGDETTNRAVDIEHIGYEISGTMLMTDTTAKLYNVTMETPGLELTKGEVYYIWVSANCDFIGALADYPKIPFGTVTSVSECGYYHANATTWYDFYDWSVGFGSSIVFDVAFKMNGDFVHADQMCSVDGSIITGSAPAALTQIEISNSEHTYSIEVDEAGLFSLEHVFAGDYTVSASNSYCEPYISSEILTAQIVNNIAINMVPLASYAVSGTVVDSDNSPINPATLKLQTSTLSFSGSTDASGAFAFEAMATQAVYQLSISSPGYAAYFAAVEVTDAAIDLGTITLEAGNSSIEGVQATCSDDDETVDLVWGLNEDVVYSQDFDVLPENWVFKTEALWRCEDGQLVCEDPGLQNSTTEEAYWNYTLRNCVVEASFSRVAGSLSGAQMINLRSQGFYSAGADSYSFKISPNGAAGIWKKSNGTTQAVVSWITTSLVNNALGDVNILKVEANENLFKFYINGTLFTTIEDGSFETGVAGLGTFINSGSGQIDKFNYFDVSPYEGKGSSQQEIVNAGGKNVGDDNPNGWSSNSRVKNFTPIPERDRAKSFAGYTVYRCKASDIGTPSAYETVVTGLEFGITEYTDDSWPPASFGVYAYGVSAIFGGATQVEFSNILDYDMACTVTIEISTNSGVTPDEVDIQLLNSDEPQFQYTLLAELQTSVTIDDFRRGIYTVSASSEGYNDFYIDAVELLEDENTIQIILDETLEAPKDLSVIDTTFFWDNNPILFFEDFDATSLIPEGWVVETTNTGISPDGLLCTWGVNAYTYTTPVVVPYGSYYMNCGFDMWGTPQNERSVMPEIDLPEAAFLKYNSAYWRGKAGFTVEISTDGGNSWSEIWNSLSTSGGMCPISNVETIDLSAFSNQSVNISFHTVQPMGTMGASWFIDNVCVTTDPTGSGKSFEDYTVFLDDDELGNTAGKEWSFEDLTVGAHTAGVKANYSSGSSEISEIDFLYGVELHTPINLAASVDQRTATISWESDGEYTTFNVYRDSLLIAEGLTETSFVDSELENGTYFYTVTQVYDYVESEMSACAIAYIFIKPDNWLWYNGPTITHPGEGFERHDRSSLWGSLTGLGAGIQIANERVVADNFIIPEGEIWEIDSLQLYMCETATYPTATLINDLRLLITDGDPSLATTDTIWGDWDLNVCSSAVMTSIFRCKLNQNAKNTTQIQLVSVNLDDLHLEAGEYWIQYSAEGNVVQTGPIQPYVTITDSLIDGNAKKHTPTTGWIDYLAGGATNIKELPFEVVGRVFYYPVIDLTAEIIQDDVTLEWNAPIEATPDSYNLYRDGGVIAEALTTTTYFDENLSNAVYNYCVEAVYGTASADPICVNAVVGYVPLSLPTDLSATVFELDVTLSWVAPLDMIPDGYEIYRDDALIGTSTDLEYVDAMLTPDIYQYFIKALYAGQASEATDAISVEVVMPDLEEPILLSAENQGDNILLSWYPPEMGGNFHQSFENQELPSEGWSVEINSAKTWHRIEELIASATYFPTDGQYQMYLPWKNGFQNEWIISPEVALFENSILTFDSHLYYGSTGNDHYYVKISTDNGTTWDVLWDASALPSGQNFYEDPITIDLSEYVGEAVKLAWNGYGEQGLTHYWLLDNIVLQGDGGKKRISFDEMEAECKMAASGEKSVITGYNVYRDGTPIAQNISDLVFLDESLSQGTYTYCVEAIYDIGISDQICITTELSYLPVAAFSTDLVEVSGSCDPMVATTEMTISNDGLADLTFTVSTETENGIDWLSTGLIAGQTYTVAPNESMAIEVVCDASELHNALFAGEIMFSTNAGNYSVDCNFAVACYNYTLFPVSNVNVDYDCSEAAITWEQPEVGSFEVELYKVYRNAYFIGSTTELSIVDDEPVSGTNEYCIKAKYAYGYSELVCGELTVDPLVAPVNLIASQENISSYNVQLTWEEPAAISEWIGYGDGINANALGNTAATTLYAAARWESEEMLPYAGSSISKIALFTASDSGAPITSEITLKIWIGPSAQTEVLSQPISVTPAAWNEIQLNQPVLISGVEEVWIGYKCEIAAGEYPIGVDAGPAVAGYGDLISADGVTWSSLANDYNFDCNYNLKAFVSEGKDGVLQHLKKEYAPAQDLSSLALNHVAGSHGDAFESKALSGYKLYRNSEDITPVSGLTMPSYEDVVPGNGIYTYNVSALYGDCESALGNDAVVDIVVGVETLTNEGIHVFPNPVNDKLFIESSLVIEKVVVYNSVGQLVDSFKVFGNYLKINTTNYNSGLYLLQITVDGETTVKRVLVNR